MPPKWPQNRPDGPQKPIQDLPKNEQTTNIKKRIQNHQKINPPAFHNFRSCMIYVFRKPTGPIVQRPSLYQRFPSSAYPWSEKISCPPSPKPPPIGPPAQNTTSISISLRFPSSAGPILTTPGPWQSQRARTKRTLGLSPYREKTLGRRPHREKNQPRSQIQGAV